MNWINKQLSFKADLMVTLLNGLVVIGGVFILNGLIARLYGLETLGEFLLVKRTLSSVIGILLIGMNVGLPNFLSQKFNKSYGDNTFFIFWLITIPLTVFFIAGIFLFDITGFNQDYFWTYLVYSLSMSAQSISYGLFRGYMNMIGANFLHLFGTAIIPITIFALGFNLYDSMLMIGLLVFSMMIIGFILRNNGLRIRNINFQHSKKILGYGLERIISFISQFILLAGIPIYIAQKVSFESVAYFNSSLSLVRLSLLIISPIGMVMLPRISNKLANNYKSDVTNILTIFLNAGIMLSIIGSAYCFINASTILEIWLGEVNETGSLILKISILALPFYTLSGLARSPIDAVSEKGYNSLVYGIAAFIMIIILIVGESFNLNMLTIALISFIVSQICAGLVSIIILQKLYNHTFFDLKLIRDIILSILFIYVINKLLTNLHLTLLNQLFFATLIYIISGIFIFVYTKKGWLADLKSKINA